MKKIYLAWLHYIWFTHKKLHKIFLKKQNYKEIFEKINYNFLKQKWFSEKQINTILKRYKEINLNSLKEKLINRKVKIITIFEENYPNNLKNINNPPFLFYIRWEIDNSPKLAIIWSRKISSYWNKIIEGLTPDLIKYFQIVSGWAAWCDTKAHKESLKNFWKTIAIIWTWIDIDYPVENEKLFWEIAKSWAIISIFPVWEVGNSYNFPVRNEVVSWLSSWILIVEAREKSWSLITAKLWLDLWKDLFATPWDIFKWGSVWTNNLIKNWEAKLVSNSQDILEEYNISTKKNKNFNINKKNNFNDKIEEAIYQLLIIDSLNLDELSKKLKIDISTISFKVSNMEIYWLIKKWIWWKYEVN